MQFFVLNHLHHMPINSLHNSSDYTHKLVLVVMWDLSTSDVPLCADLFTLIMLKLKIVQDSLQSITDEVLNSSHTQACRCVWFDVMGMIVF